MKYSLPTLRMLGSGFHLEHRSVAVTMKSQETCPEIMGFLMAFTRASNDPKSTMKEVMIQPKK